MAELNQLYMSHSAFWADDYRLEGFRWIDCHQEEKCVYIMERKSSEETLIAAFTFSSEEQTTEIETAGTQLTLLFDTDWEQYGGRTASHQMKVTTRKGFLILTMAPFSGSLFSSQ